jgi:hypothetical protein
MAASDRTNATATNDEINFFILIPPSAENKIFQE